MKRPSKKIVVIECEATVFQCLNIEETDWCTPLSRRREDSKMAIRQLIRHLAARTRQEHNHWNSKFILRSSERRHDCQWKLSTPFIDILQGPSVQHKECSHTWRGEREESGNAGWDKRLLDEGSGSGFSGQAVQSIYARREEEEKRCLNQGALSAKSGLGFGVSFASFEALQTLAMARVGGRRIFPESGSRGAFASGFLEHKNVRFASTAAAVGDGLHFVQGETGDAVQTSLAGVHEAALDVVASVGSVSEVAAATADCSVPTAALQHLIDYIHMQTGLPWWLSIAATTLAIRIMVLPVLVFQMKATARLTLLRPELERITNAIKESGYDPKVTEVNQKRMKDLFVKHKTNPFSPLIGAFVQAPLFISFFFAIRNMAEKVPSFQEGGALWFTDLTTPDSMYILPVMSGLFTLATIEVGAMDGMQGQPMMGKMKMFFRGFAILIIPLTASFPKALFCYWLTTNMCSLLQTSVLRQPAVKRAVGIPETAHLTAPIVQAPTATASIVTLSNPPKRPKKGKT